jgi:hypothetical protein
VISGIQRLYYVSLDSFFAVLDAVAWKPRSKMADVVQFSGLSLSTCRKALRAATELGLVTQVAKDEYCCVAEYDGRLSLDQKITVFKKHLQNYRPFHIMCEFLALDEDTESAMRKTLVLLDAVDTVPAGLEPLLRWGQDTTILQCVNGRYEISPGLVQAIQFDDLPTAEDLSSEMAISLFISRQLSPECYSTLETPDRNHLVTALGVYETDPEKSCEEAGKVLENYLRLIGNADGVDTSKANGIVQVANQLLAAKRDSIHPKHKSIAESISAIRSVSAHSRDKLTNMPWNKTSQAALHTTLLVLDLIRSIHKWRHRRVQEI